MWYDSLLQDKYIDYFSNDNNTFTFIENGEVRLAPLFKEFKDLVIYLTNDDTTKKDANFIDIWHSRGCNYDTPIEKLSDEQCAVLLVYPFWSRMDGGFEVSFRNDGRLKKYLLALKKKRGRINPSAIKDANIMLFRNMLNIRKRDCGIKIRLVPYGGGWTDVYLDIGGDSHYFIISYVFGDQFGALLALLYKLHPANSGAEYEGVEIDYKIGICEKTADGYNVVKIVDCGDDHTTPCVCRDIPWRGRFTWDEEGAYSKWTLERTPDENADFMLNICIEHRRTFKYTVPYKDFCYAVAKACTEMLKKHGFGGYHNSTYTQDMNVRHLLFIKSVALNNFEATDLTYYQEQGCGETSDFQKELELLLFDM